MAKSSDQGHTTVLQVNPRIPRLLLLIVSLGTAVLVALVGRRLATAQSKGRSAGESVTLPTLTGVLDTGGGLWRGPAPGALGYDELAAAGCTLVVDLRAEADAGESRRRAEAAGVGLLILPTDNTRPPQLDHVDRVIASRAAAVGATYVHCEAGEGRTGAIVGALAVRDGVKPGAAMADALSVGSLTFSQLVFVASGARLALVPTLIDWLVDRPTEIVFGALRSASSA